jgi:hypothetical protein
MYLTETVKQGFLIDAVLVMGQELGERQTSPCLNTVNKMYGGGDKLHAYIFSIWAKYHRENSLLMLRKETQPNA